jgi:hypothetical protein
MIPFARVCASTCEHARRNKGMGMMLAVSTRFLSNDQLWREIQSRIRRAKRVRAAVAYFGGRGAKLLSLKDRDTLVVDMSIGAVRQGITNPGAVRTLMGRGVKVFSRGSLHAKFLLIDNALIASSANASLNSKEILDEAGIITTDPAAVRRAADFFEKLCTERVGRKYLKKCIAEYRPPKFKPAIERRQSRAKGSRRVVEAKLWFIGGLVAITLSDDARESIERVERRVAKRLKRPEQTEVSWIRYGRKPSFFRHLRIGDWIVDCNKEGRGRYVGPPAQLLGIDKWESPRGARYAMLMLEAPSNGESMPLSQFRKKVAAIEPRLNRPNPRTRPIGDNDCADSILRLWTATGKIAKGRGR